MISLHLFLIWDKTYFIIFCLKTISQTHKVFPTHFHKRKFTITHRGDHHRAAKYYYLYLLIKKRSQPQQNDIQPLRL